MPAPPPRVFLLSPANCSGQRARILLRPEARFDLAVRLRERGAPLGEVFAFMSGLYFRGKLAYARAFGRPPRGVPRGLVITTNAGLLDVEQVVGGATVAGFAGGRIDAADEGYRAPLLRDAAKLKKKMGRAGEVVLLGSVATGKYVEVLAEVFGERLLFPSDFVGRGDMSRGGLMLRCVHAGLELPYVPVLGATRHGARPPKLDPRTRPPLRLP